MTIRDVLHFPDTRLRTKAQAITEVDDPIRQLIADMFETMYAKSGIGLAATQINVHKQVVVIDISPKNDQALCLINPEIVEMKGAVINEEGCLSVPDIHAEVNRAEYIRVKALNEQGEAIEFAAEGLLAICIQHELDHLKGKLFVDYLSPLKFKRLRDKLKKQKKQKNAELD